MKKTRIVLPALAVLFLSTASACSFSTGTKTTEKTVDPVITHTAEPTQTALVEVGDCEDVESGDYYTNGAVYTINKTAKKLKSVTYEGNDYNKYKAGQGTLNFEADIKFVEYGDTHAVYFIKDSKETFIYKSTSLSGTPTITMKTITRTSTSSSSSSSNISKMPAAYPTITYGSYISGAINQDARDEQGQRITNPEGGYVKKDYYYHFDLTETSIKVYVSESAETHAEEPTYKLDNYKVVFNQAALLIQIPKPEFTCSMSFVAKDNTIRFTDSSGEGSIYSGSGNLTLKA